MTIIWIFGSILLVGAVSLIGVVALSLKETLLHRLLFLLVPLAAGALIGDSLFHLLPESFESSSNGVVVSFATIAGMLTFFVLEKFLHWHHAHHGKEEEHAGHDCVDHENRPRHLAPLVITADAVHNFIDGMIIAGSFLVSIPLGVATTIAVILHEIPQEIADFGLLIHSGLSKTKALLFNFLSALTAFLGAGLALAMSDVIEQFSILALAFTGGSFLYIAIADIVPELHKERRLSYGIAQFASLLLGIALMALLLMLE